MKRTIVLIPSLFLLVSMNAQNGNWVLTKTYLDEADTVRNNIDISYYNGLGYVDQIINVKGSPLAKNIISPVFYDGLIRDNSRVYLPYVSTNSGNVRDEDPFVRQKEFFDSYITLGEGDYAFTENRFDNPFNNRIVSNRQAGLIMAHTDKRKKISYTLNDQSDNLKCLRLVNAGVGANGGIVNCGYYAANLINITRTESEDRNVIFEFVNQRGQLILSRSSTSVNNEGGRCADTYYVYDDFGNLCYVLPPELSERIVSGELVDLSDDNPEMCRFAYTYKYDHRNRLTYKRLPGTDPVLMVYDKADRLVLSQDGNLRENNEWMYFVYDNLNRVIEQSVMVDEHNNHISNLQGYYDDDRLKSLTEILFSLKKNLRSVRYGGALYIRKEMDTTESEEIIVPVDFQHLWVIDTTEIRDIDEYDLHSLKNNALAQLYFNFNEFSLFGINEAFKVNSEDYWREGNQYRYDYKHMAYYVPQEFMEPTFINGHNTTIYDFYTHWLGHYADPVDSENEPYSSIVLIPDPIITYTTYNEPFDVPSELAFRSVDNVLSLVDLDLRTNGMKIYEKIAVLNGDAVGEDFIERAFYYDDRGRLIQTVEKNHLGGISRYSTKYDFVGNILISHESHSNASGAETDEKLIRFTHDHRGRLLSEATTVNGSDPALVSYGYDELGKLVSKTYGTGDGAVTDSLTYNIQGWLTSQSNDLFDMQLRYYDPDPLTMPAGGTVAPSYTGNITQWTWQQKEPGSPGQQNSYGFTYDGLSRLTDSRLFERSGSGWTSTGNFRETMTMAESGTLSAPTPYDLNGNINYLLRTDAAGATLDEFRYQYDGNKLSAIIDATQEMPLVEGRYFEITLFMCPGFEVDRTSDPQGKFLLAEHMAKPEYLIEPEYPNCDWEYYYIPEDCWDIVNTIVANDTYQMYQIVDWYPGIGTPLTSLSPEKTYTYDANGNMTHDGRKALDFSYNLLNLVEEVSEAGSGGAVAASYTWLADGTKLQVTDNAGNGYMYLGSLVYKRSAGNGGDGDWELESTGFGGGRIIASHGSGSGGSSGSGSGSSGTGSSGSATIYTPNYHITDHLGSVRVVFAYNDGVPEVLAQNDYYPFGLQHQNAGLLAGNDTNNRFLYNGKENQTTGALRLLDYGARMNDVELGRWFVIDPLAEKYYPWSPYNYALNNPIRFIDPDGREVTGYVVDNNGRLTKVSNIGGNLLDVIYSAEAYAAGENAYSLDGKTGGIVIGHYIVENMELSSWNYYDVEAIETVADGYQELIINDEITASRLFEFLSDNTKVEWANQHYENASGETTNRIITNRARSSVNTSPTDRKMQKNGNNLKKSDHNHPRDEGKSTKASKGDKNNFMEQKSADSSYRARIYYKGKYYEYDEKGIK